MQRQNSQWMENDCVKGEFTYVLDLARGAEPRIVFANHQLWEYYSVDKMIKRNDWKQKLLNLNKLAKSKKLFLHSKIWIFITLRTFNWTQVNSKTERRAVPNLSSQSLLSPFCNITTSEESLKDSGTSIVLVALIAIKLAWAPEARTRRLWE